MSSKQINLEKTTVTLNVWFEILAKRQFGERILSYGQRQWCHCCLQCIFFMAQDTINMCNVKNTEIRFLNFFGMWKSIV